MSFLNEMYCKLLLLYGIIIWIFKNYKHCEFHKRSRIRCINKEHTEYHHFWINEINSSANKYNISFVKFFWLYSKSTQVKGRERERETGEGSNQISNIILKFKHLRTHPNVIIWKSNTWISLANHVWELKNRNPNTYILSNDVIFIHYGLGQRKK